MTILEPKAKLQSGSTPSDEKVSADCDEEEANEPLL
jgi:hypothetical protein